MKILYGRGWAASLFLFSMLALPLAFAQMGPGQGRRARMYNPATETTVKGTVEDVKTVSGRHGWHGTHLMLKSDGKKLDVHLGPEAFLKEKGFSFAKGEQVEVIGSKANYRGREAIIAREVKKGGKTLILRDTQGIPQWSGRGRR